LAFIAEACFVVGGVSDGSERSASAPQHQYNLILNGGFERWAALAPSVASRETVKNLRLVPPDLAPTGWSPAREVVRGQGPTAVVARDDKVKHSGSYSVRIENRAMRDITYVSYSTEGSAKRPGDPRNIRPNRRYLLRWWVRGQKVEPSGAGPLMMMYYMSRKQGQWYRTNADYETILADTEELIQYVTKTILGGTVINFGQITIDIGQPWTRINVSDAFIQHAGWNPVKEFDADRFDLDLINKVEPALPHDRGVILIDYPAEAAAQADIVTLITAKILFFDMHYYIKKKVLKRVIL
jgi:hypothetical protein